MSKNPFYNAIVALAYIILVVLLMNWASSNVAMESSLLMPIMIISLFTLSAAIMGYIFCYQPLRLFLEGEKEKAVKLFIKTVIIFATILFILFVTYFLLIKS